MVKMLEKIHIIEQKLSPLAWVGTTSLIDDSMFRAATMCRPFVEMFACRAERFCWSCDLSSSI